MKGFLAVILIAVIILTVATLWRQADRTGFVPSNETGFCGWSTYGTCTTDTDCMTGGCSGQVCQSRTEEPVITTCEIRDCYDAARYGLACGCITGQCQWKGI